MVARRPEVTHLQARTIAEDRLAVMVPAAGALLEALDDYLRLHDISVNELPAESPLRRAAIALRATL